MLFVRRLMRKKRKVFVCGAVLLLLSVLLQLAARKADGFAGWYVRTVYSLLVGALGRIFGLFPFSVSEVGLYLLLISALAAVFRFRKKKIQLLAGSFCLASGLFFSYTVCCGINYFGQPFSASLSFSQEKYGKEELSELLEWLTEQVNACYVETGLHSVRQMGTLGVEAMECLGETYPALAGFYPQPKALLNSRLLSVQQLAGIYSPFTVEANYNKEMTAYNIPHTICHELSHLRGFMREDEANFIGFLACIGSEDPEYRYSGYLSGWIYAGNALAGEDYEAYWASYRQLREEVRRDLGENSLFWNRFESRISEVSETVNDTYLKANRQSEGVKSYGRAVDLMLGWYRQQQGKNGGEIPKKIVLLTLE